jgi:hypothetical protein
MSAAEQTTLDEKVTCDLKIVELCTLSSLDHGGWKYADCRPPEVEGRAHFTGFARGIASQGRLVIMLHGLPRTDRSYRDLPPGLLGFASARWRFPAGYSLRAQPTDVAS